MTGLRAEIKLWFERPFDEYAQALLEAYDFLLGPVREQLKWSQIYTTNKLARATAKAFAAPHEWFAAGAPSKPRMAYFTGPGEKTALGDYALQLESHPDGARNSDSNTPYLRLVVPAHDLFEDAESFVERARVLCNRLPFLSGYAGFVLDTSPYFESQAFRAAFPLALAHPGVHITGDQATWALRDEPGLETVSWLTMVGKTPLKRLGGSAALRKRLARHPAIEVHDVEHGVIVQAGASARIGGPEPSDDLQLYAQVYAALAKVLEPVIRDMRPLLIHDDLERANQMTMGWLRRFTTKP